MEPPLTSGLVNLLTKFFPKFLNHFLLFSTSRASLIETQESTTKIKVEEDEILAKERETESFLLLLLVVHLLGFLPINIYKSVSCLFLPDHHHVAGCVCPLSSPWPPPSPSSSSSGCHSCLPSQPLSSTSAGSETGNKNQHTG